MVHLSESLSAWIAARKSKTAALESIPELLASTFAGRGIVMPQPEHAASRGKNSSLSQPSPAAEIAPRNRKSTPNDYCPPEVYIG